MKLFHLHLVNSMGNRSTLICKLKEGSIGYIHYGGHSSEGTPYALSNIQAALPVDKLNDNETKEEFKKRVIDIINNKSVCKVVNEVNTNISF